MFFFFVRYTPDLECYLPPRGGRLALGLSGVSSGDLRSLLGCRALEVLTVWRFSGARGGCESVKEQGGSPPAGELAGGVAVRPSGIRWKKRWRGGGGRGGGVCFPRVRPFDPRQTDRQTDREPASQKEEESSRQQAVKMMICQL